MPNQLLDQLVEVKERFKRLRRERCLVEAETFRTTVKIIGHAFAYRPDSGGVDGCEKHRKVIDVQFPSNYGCIAYEACCIGASGRPSIELVSELFSMETNLDLSVAEQGWEPCTPEEYNSARLRVLAQLDDPTLWREAMQSGRGVY